MNTHRDEDHSAELARRFAKKPMPSLEEAWGQLEARGY